MITLLLVNATLAAAPPTVNVTRTCSTTSASANLNGGWEVLGQRGRDEQSQANSDAGHATATVRAEWADERSTDLCPPDDPMSGLKGASETMLEVQLPEPGKPRTCVTTARAAVRGGSTAEATVDPTIHVSARSAADLTVEATNSSVVSADIGAAGSFTGAWSWKGKGPNTDVRGSVTISAAQAYARASIEVPGFLKAQVYEGKVDAWVREGDHYERVQADAPVTLEPFGTLAGGKGGLCVTGSASLGGVADGRARAVAGDSALDASFRLTVSEQYPALVTGEQPEFGPCGCE